MPARLVDLLPPSQASAVRRRQFIVNSGVCMNRTQAGGHADMVALTGINGQTFDMERIDVETKLGTSEIWEVISAGMAHPFHIHGALFRILSIAGAAPPPHLAGWKDVVLVEDEVELLVYFSQPATRDHPFMYHCHILEHEEAGLMGQYVCN
jgi:FtsP/CotA-like multicopper oxidase with cupredoxin domain